MHKPVALPITLLILIALTQGLALLLLHQSLELEFWPYQDPQWLLCFYAITITAPTLLLLGLKDDKSRSFLLSILGFAALAGLIGYYSGHQLRPMNLIRLGNVLPSLIITMSLASFLALIYLQSQLRTMRFSYRELFEHSWRNVLTLAFALLFTAVFWGILMLWAGLFKAIEIDFFFDLFTERWFFYPILALANGLGVIIFRRLAHIIDTIVRLLHALFNFLLVVLVFVALIFLFALPFAGLQPLWDSGGSALILAMQALMLFFINGVYQAEKYDRPYPLWVHRFITIGMLTLPIYSAISFYGLTLRVEQYGWTVSRCWALLLWLVLTLFALGYVWQIIRQRLKWFSALAGVNTLLGLIILALLLTVNSPLLDFRKISVQSQLSRLAHSEVSIDKFDIRYFRYELARPGHLALQQLKTEYPERANAIDRLYRNKGVDFNFDSFRLRLTLLPGDIPESVQRYAQNKIVRNWYTDDRTLHYYILACDPDQDDQTDYLFVRQLENSIQYNLIHGTADNWQHLKTRTALYSDDETVLLSFIEALKQQSFNYISPRWRDLEIDGVHLPLTN